MIRVWLTWSDGHYSGRELTEAEASDALAKGCTVVTIRDGTWRAWLTLCDQMVAFDQLWTELANQHARERSAGEVIP